ncbi:succinylglutamate desuccinylase/aspartoacylase family protein [Candidatus Bipolaricaulota bacterium]|nr:succinylglutamate desuccinylase/aspartoacylase family protein [Candidatus Bipolaricaulota bacterium]
MNQKLKGRIFSLSLFLLLIVFTFTALARAPVSHDIRPGYGVNDIKWLSDYFQPLHDTPGDSKVYVLQGEDPSGKALILGGTHSNEAAGILTAILLVEQSNVSVGTLYVVPHANNSASSYTDPRYEVPEWLEFSGNSGERTFRYGARYTNSEHQTGDPDNFIHPSGREFPGSEARNLNRVHPGKPDGTLTQRISYSLFELVKEEKVDVIIDMHEAGPQSRLSNTLVAHPGSLDIAAMAKINLEMNGLDIKLEKSRPKEKFPGLSHREFGDHTDAYPFLTETKNPGQTEGKDLDRVYKDPKNPIEERVKIQLKLIQEIISSYNSYNSSGKQLKYEMSFSFAELLEKGIDSVLR